MKIQSIYKVPQGKLIKIHLDVDDTQDTMNHITITGDFFAYPEESISDLETKLAGIPFDKKEIHQIISDFISEHNVQFIGIDAASITEAIMRCA